MTAAEWDDLERLAQAATPGPWRVWKGDESRRGAVVETAWSHDANGADTELITDWCSPADAEFIAAARTAIPALIAEVRRLRAERDRCPDCNASAWVEYTNTRAERDALAARLAAVEALLDGPKVCLCVKESDLRAALETDTTKETP